MGIKAFLFMEKYVVSLGISILLVRTLWSHWAAQTTLLATLSRLPSCSNIKSANFF